MADILLIHNNFPAQFVAIAAALVAQGHRCVAIGSATAVAIEGVELFRWSPPRGSTAGILPEATRIEADLIRGGAAAAIAAKLREQGFAPALIIGHTGWGETSYMRELFPDARQILYAEYYYRSTGGDVGFDPEFAAPSPTPWVLNAKNAGMALALAEADAIVAPTAFQRSLLPPAFQPRARIIHEGVDTAAVSRRPAVPVTLADGTVIDGARPLVTMVNRRLEPLRGFHIFMRALPALLAAIPDAEVVVIGADESGGYGRAAPAGTSWGRVMLDELGGRLDRSRVHLAGRVPHEQMLQLLSLSGAHVYYTYPFVMSWSLLEAMACECLIVGSDTAPVRDAVTNGVDGILLDFFDVPALSATLIDACRRPAAYAGIRKAARQTIVGRFDRAAICQPQWLALVDRALAGDLSS